MSIYCIGDSWTYGSELADPERYSWPAALSRLTGRTVINQGKEACGNTRIVKRVIDAAFNEDADIVIIAWTNPERKELFTNDVLNVWPGHPKNNKVWPLGYERENQYITYQNDINKILTTCHCDKMERWATRQWYRDIILTQSLLEKQNKKYAMVSTFTPWNFDEKDSELKDQIDFGRFIGYPVAPEYYFETMSSWVKDCPAGPGHHPLQKGQQLIAEKIYEYIRNFGWVS